MNQPSYRINDTLQFNPNDPTLERLGSKESLEPLVSSLAKFLIENEHRPVKHEELIEKFWGPTVKGEEALMKAISKARKKFGSETIKTISKVGYRWQARTEKVNPQSLRLPKFIEDLLGTRMTIVLIIVCLFILKSILFPHAH